jgi:hypothetical protein
LAAFFLKQEEIMKTIVQLAIALTFALLSHQAVSGPPPGKGKQDQLATFDMIASGVITSDVRCLDDPNADGFLGCKKQVDGSTIDVTLGTFFTHRTYDDGALGANCFSQGPTFSGTIQLAEDQQGEDRAVYRFTALAADGQTSVQYVFRFSDPHLSWDNGFPPAAGQTSTLIATHWEVDYQSKYGKYGPCSGSGALSGADIVTVKLTRLPEE